MDKMTDDVGHVLSEHLAAKDDEGHVVVQIAQIATVYFTDAHMREVRERIVTCCERYFARWGDRLRWALMEDQTFMEPFGAGSGSNPRAWLPDLGEDEGFTLMYHGAEFDRGASVFAIKALGVERRPLFEIGYLQLALPVLSPEGGWALLPETLLEVCQTLNPVSGYGGIGFTLSPVRRLANQRARTIYGWAQRFPGLEVDYPVSHTNWLRTGRDGRDGIKGVNWLTVVGDRYLDELGGADKVAADVAALDPAFAVHRFDGGLLLQAGPRPELGDAQRDLWPTLYIKLAKYLKPIRVTRHAPFQRGEPDLYFTKEESVAWLGRFDDREA